MLRSLYTGTTGLKGFQKGLDNIGNNISNVNTTAYKSASTTFGTLLNQNLANASGATQSTASVNSKQIGLGMSVAATTVNITKGGSAQTTGDALDFRIDGTSFFVVHKGEEEFYTRDGAFEIDANGDLVTRNKGYYVYGWMSGDGQTVNTAGPIEKLNVMKVNEDDIYSEATSYIRIEGNLDYKDEGLYSDGGRTVNVDAYGADGKLYTLTFAFKDNNDAEERTFDLSLVGVKDEDGYYTDVTGGASIALEFDGTGKLSRANGETEGIATLNLPGAMGGAAATIDVTNLTCVSSGAYDVAIKGGLPSWVGIDEESDKKGYMASVHITDETDRGEAEVGKHSGSIVDFSKLTADNKSELINQGFYFTCCTCDRYYSVQFVEGNETELQMSGRHYIYKIGIDEVNSGEDLVNKIIEATDSGNPEGHFTLLDQDKDNPAVLNVYDERSMDYVSADENYGMFGRGVAGMKTIPYKTSMTALKGDADGQGAGLPVGKRNGFATDFSGKMYATYDNGARRLIGQMAVADFQNPTGLEKVGDNLYGSTLNSGEITIHDVTERNGKIIDRQLEMSNVELSTEMTSMILMQRAFQASSRVITTSDSMLQTVSDLKR